MHEAAQAVFMAIRCGGGWRLGPRCPPQRFVGRNAQKAGPAAIYAGLLHYAQTKNYNPGWAAHSFKKIFGTWPRPQDRKAEPTPLPNFLIDEWAARRERRK
jgi:hypothetical protein